MTRNSKRLIAIIRTVLAVSLLAGFLAACAGGSSGSPGEADVVGRYCTAETPFTVPPQPDNVGDLKANHAPRETVAKAMEAARKYYTSREYMTEMASVDADAKDYVVRHAQGHAANGKLVLVLDIDETSLSNWPEIDADNFNYYPDGPCPIGKTGKISGHSCGMLAWDMMMKATAIKPTLALFNAAKMQGVPVFFITGRDENERGWTEANLRQAGYEGWQELILRPLSNKETAATFKTRERAKLMDRGYTILANVGDQPSDLKGGCAESAFLLPDPFYRVP